MGLAVRLQKTVRVSVWLYFFHLKFRLCYRALRLCFKIYIAQHIFKRACVHGKGRQARTFGVHFFVCLILSRKNSFSNRGWIFQTHFFLTSLSIPITIASNFSFTTFSETRQKMIFNKRINSHLLLFLMNKIYQK